MDKENFSGRNSHVIQVGRAAEHHFLHTSILDRYMRKAAQNGGELLPDQMYEFLSGENARVLARCHDGSLDEKTLKECYDFAEYYTSKVSPETIRAMSDRFGELPFFLQSAVNAIPDTTFPLDLKLTDAQYTELSALAKYIEEMQMSRLVIFCIKSGEEKNFFERLSLSSDMASLEMQMNKKDFLICASYMIQMGGRMTVQQYFPDGKCVLLGFSAANGELHPISAENLKEDYQKSPECFEANIQNITFVTPALL